VSSLRAVTGAALLLVVSLASTLAPGPASAEAPPTGRLPRDVVPLHHALRLEIDPEAAGFAGEVRIRVRLEAPARTLWLHARELEITSASVTPEGAPAVALAAAIVHESGVLRLAAPAELPSGAAELVLAFRAPYGTQLDGTYQVRASGRSYVMTQMEPLAARKSFPCFDEPSWKTPWDVTLVVPTASVAVANARELRRTELPGGRSERVFATTAPLPSYLVAYAVGPWDVVTSAPIAPNGQRTRPLPLRGLAVAGRGPELRFALGETARLVAALEAWFDLAYPFDKLDLLAAPDFAFGAMENAGLVTYHERWLLQGERTPTALRQGFFAIHLHELAHQWFGNSVTMPWWDDLWLNEAFASWLAQKLVGELEPGFRIDLKQLGAVRAAMAADSLASARRIAEPVDDYRDVASAFDGITYQKGAAVLGMFEAYLGAERFQAALRAHVRAHAGGHATSRDLVAALARVADDPAGLAAAFGTFLDQPGVPLVSLASECRDGRPHLGLAQQRFLPLGSRAEAERVWGLPVCVRHGSAEGAQCALVREPRAELALRGGACGSWVMPNAGGAGYYRFALPPDEWARLEGTFASLAPREQGMTADALTAGFERGTRAPADVLRGASRIAASPDWPVASAPLPTLGWLREQLAGAAERPLLDAWTRRVYGPRLAALGTEERPGEPDEPRLERQALLGLLARANDGALRARLAARARAAFEDGRLVAERLPADSRGSALWVLAQDGAAAEFAALETALRAETEATLRRDLLRALGSARAPQRAARARALALDAAVRPGEMFALLGTHFDWEENRRRARAWLLENADALFAKLPALHAASAPALFAAGACSEREAEAVEAHFAARLAGLEGGPRALAELGEGIRLCAALRAHHARAGFGDALAEPSGAVPR